MGVTTSDTAQGRLKMLHDTSGLSWRRIAALEAYEGIPAGTLATIGKTGMVPKKWRGRFGLAEMATITVMDGEVPAGSQSISARRCECGEWFISNHPRRRRCFMCSPWRGRR